MRVLSRAERTAGLLALALGLLRQLVRPDAGTDLAAQLARASFARQAPLTPVDFSWYDGIHPFGYSLLSPWIMAALGVAISGLVAEVAGAVLFARLMRDLRRPMLVAVSGAVFSVLDVASGRTTFALGAVAALVALLVREHRVWAGLLAVLCALLSPVAAAFVGLAAAVLVLHRRRGGWTLGLGSAIPVLLLDELFSGGGVQPFSTGAAVPGILVAAGLLALTRVSVVRTGAALYVVAVIFFAAHDDPFGSNILRLGLLVAVSLLLATSDLSRRWLVVASLGCLAFQVDPAVGDLTSSRGPELQGLTQELVALHSQRVEVVAPREHRESWVVAEKVPLARGWGRQIDNRDNRLFYQGTLTAQAFLAWLHLHAVDHVAVPRGVSIDFGGDREARLLARPVDGLTQVWQDRDWTVYRVDAPRPLVALPAVVTLSGRTALTVRTPVATSVHVVLRWSRWLNVTGPACIEQDRGEVRMRFRSAGTATIGSSLLPAGHC